MAKRVPCRSMHSAISDLSCYIIIIYKMWGDRDPEYCHLGEFALSL